MLLLLLACADPALEDSQLEDEDTELGADDSNTGQPGKGKVYAGPVLVQSPTGSDAPAFCEGEVEISIKSGAFTGTGGCLATPPEGESLELPVTVQGTVDEDDSCSGVITMSMAHPEGELELSGDLSGAIARGTMSLDFVLELPPPPDSEDEPGEAQGSIEAEVQDSPQD